MSEPTSTPPVTPPAPEPAPTAPVDPTPTPTPAPPAAPLPDIPPATEPQPPAGLPDHLKGLTRDGMAASILGQSGLFSSTGDVQGVQMPGQPAQSQPQPQEPTAQPQPQPQESQEPTPSAEPQEPASPDDIPEDPPGEKPSARSRHAWAQLRSMVKEREAELEQIQKDLEERDRRLAAMAEEVKNKEEAAKDLEERLGRTNLSQSPRFQEKYNAQFHKLADRVQRTLTQYGGVNEEQARAVADRVMTATPKEIAELSKKLDPAIAGAIVTASADAQALWTERQQELDNWRESTTADAQQLAQRDAVASTKARREMADNAIKQALEFGVDLYNTENADIAEFAQEATEQFQGFAQSATHEELMQLAALGNALPAYMEVMNVQQERINQLEELVKSHGYALNIPGETSAPAPPAPAPQDTGATLFEGSKDPVKTAEGALGQMLGEMRQQLGVRL